MNKKCFMCSKELNPDDLVGLCPKCMYETFGEKMADHIVNNFKEAKQKGTLLFSDWFLAYLFK